VAEALRFFGLFRSKLASANAKALTQLYDYLPSRARIIAKRSFVLYLAELDLDEKEPGHEMLDVISTTVDSYITPFSGRFGSGCTPLQTIINDRSTLLSLAHKLLHIFSTVSTAAKLVPKIGITAMQSFYHMGQKRVGKSSVARVLYNEFSTNKIYIPVYITLGELTTTSVGSMMYSLQKSLAENTPHRNV
jgi:hypothetical protein